MSGNSIRLNVSLKIELRSLFLFLSRATFCGGLTASFSTQSQIMWHSLIFCNSSTVFCPYVYNPCVLLNGMKNQYFSERWILFGKHSFFIWNISPCLFKWRIFCFTILISIDCSTSLMEERQILKHSITVRRNINIQHNSNFHHQTNGDSI